MTHVYTRIRFDEILVATSVALVMLAVSPAVAYATPFGAGSTCTMIGQTMNSGVGRAIATIGVMGVGIGATFGRVDWKQAMTVACGVSAMYSTAYFIGFLSGGDGSCWG